MYHIVEQAFYLPQEYSRKSSKSSASNEYSTVNSNPHSYSGKSNKPYYPKTQKYKYSPLPHLSSYY